jgi:hypothetical protein
MKTDIGFQDWARAFLIDPSAEKRESVRETSPSKSILTKLDDRPPKLAYSFFIFLTFIPDVEQRARQEYLDSINKFRTNK